MTREKMVRLMALAEHETRHQILGHDADHAKLPALMVAKAVGISARFLQYEAAYQAQLDALHAMTGEGAAATDAIRDGRLDDNKELSDALEQALGAGLAITNPKFVTG